MNLINSANQLFRISYRHSAYSKIMVAMIKKGVPFREILITKFPYNFSDNKQPCSVSVEMGNVCNLDCSYCNVPLYSTRREFMNDKVFEKLIERLSEVKINRIRIGGGEPTLHPKLEEYLKELSRHTKFLSLVTNGQWNKDNIAETLVDHLDMIEISVDAGGREIYERSRKGADYALLMSNLKNIAALRARRNPGVHINIRYMVRPSTRSAIRTEKAFLQPFCDTIMTQLLCQMKERRALEDLFMPRYIAADEYPRCTLPFKDMLIKLNGDIPYCAVSGSTVEHEQLMAGSVFNDSIKKVWNVEVKKIRDEHRTRSFESTLSSFCKGCYGP